MPVAVIGGKAKNDEEDNPAGNDAVIVFKLILRDEKKIPHQHDEVITRKKRKEYKGNFFQCDKKLNPGF